MALHSLYCADVPLRNCSLTPWSGSHPEARWHRHICQPDSHRLYRLPLLSAKPTVWRFYVSLIPTREHHRPLAGTKLYCGHCGIWIYKPGVCVVTFDYVRLFTYSGRRRAVVRSEAGIVPATGPGCTASTASEPRGTVSREPLNHKYWRSVHLQQHLYRPIAHRFAILCLHRTTHACFCPRVLHARFW